MQVQLSLCCFLIYSLSYLFIYFLNAVSPFLALIVWSLKVTVETEALPSPPAPTTNQRFCSLDLDA